VVQCGDGDRVAILFLKDCVSFLFMCQWSWRGSCFGKSNIHIRGEALSVCFFCLLQMKGAVFAEGGYSSVALALFCLLPTCLHLQQNKKVLEADLLLLTNCPLPITSQQNCSHGL